MNEKMNKRLHGARRAKNHCALLLIDFINDFDFPEGEALAPRALAAARAAAKLKKRARAADVPVIYVNDNFGRWQSQFDQAVAHCMRRGCLGRAVAGTLKPLKHDYFVLKPRHSAFYLTPLPLLLEDLGVRELILTGLLADSCVLFSANDAYLRNLRVHVPSDCIAAIEDAHAEEALGYMRRALKADTRPGAEIEFGARK